MEVTYVREATTKGNSASATKEENWNNIKILISPRPMSTADLLSREPRKEYLNISLPLYQAALKGDWETARGLIETHPSVIRRPITKGCETALHIASAAKHTHFVEELVNLMDPDDLELRSENDNTALCFAATAGIVRIAEVMVKMNGRLPMIRGSKGMTPLYMAALFGHSDMVWYLYTKTKVDDLKEEDRIGVLNTCIKTGIYDMALEILQKYPELAVARDGEDETALHVLARKPSAFSDGYQPGIWRKFVNSILPVGMKRADKCLKQNQALQLVEYLWKLILPMDESEISALIRSPSRLLLDAAELGNDKFLSVLIRANPDLIWKVDDENRSIFHIAVLHRQETIFNMLYELGAIKDLITSYSDGEGNTIFHLAGRLAPPNRLSVVSGAVLQMQRELLWFKEVEKMVHPSYVESKNSEGQTAQALFTREHKDLMKEGEKWMKEITTSSMIVATLIAIVVFAAAFTIPGGNNSSGTPVFLKKSSFMVFAISDAITLFTSSTSLVMFFSILTSRYTEMDFFESLPSKLMIGLAMLFLSITNMMIAYIAAFFIIYDCNLEWVPILIALFASVPILAFATLQYPLLVEVIHSGYGSRYLFTPTKRILFY